MSQINDDQIIAIKFNLLAKGGISHPSCDPETKAIHREYFSVSQSGSSFAGDVKVTSVCSSRSPQAGPMLIIKRLVVNYF